MVDEILTPNQFRDQWQNFPDLFEAYWFDTIAGKLYYLRRPGPVLIGQVSITAYGGSDPLRNVAAINQFIVYRIRNPATSGVRLIITRIIVTSTEARQFRIYTSTSTVPTATDRTGTILFKGKAQDTPTSATVCSFDNNVANLAIGGFGVIHIEQLQALVPRDYVMMTGYESLPVHAMDISVGDTTDTAAEQSTFSIEWLEI